MRRSCRRRRACGAGVRACGEGNALRVESALMPVCRKRGCRTTRRRGAMTDDSARPTPSERPPCSPPGACSAVVPTRRGLQVGDGWCIVSAGRYGVTSTVERRSFVRRRAVLGMALGFPDRSAAEETAGRPQRPFRASQSPNWLVRSLPPPDEVAAISGPVAASPVATRQGTRCRFDSRSRPASARRASRPSPCPALCSARIVDG